MSTLTAATPVTYLAAPGPRPGWPFRCVLASGSRTWWHRPTVRYALAPLWHPDTYLITGACDQGVDLLAAQCWTAWGGHVNLWPADWTGPCRDDCPPGHRVQRRGRWICPRAGLVRNTNMVTQGLPDLVVSLIHRDSPGATHCTRVARQAGVTITVYRAHQQPPEWATLAE